MNICRNETARLVGMEINESKKCLKTLERVKGIEPSYSAWKAAALPLSYTRASGDALSRRADRLNRPAPVLTACQQVLFPRPPRRRRRRP